MTKQNKNHTGSQVSNISNKPKISNSTMNKLLVIIIFLGFAAIAFYFTFDEKIINNEKVVSDLITMDDNLPEVGPITESEKITHNIAKTKDIVKLSKLKNLQQWNKILINYYSGKDITGDLDNFENNITNQAIIQQIESLKKVIGEFGTYNPIKAYLEFEKVKDNLYKEKSQIKLKSRMGEMVNEFITIRSNNFQDSTYDKLLEIEQLLDDQEFNLAWQKLVIIQEKCNCFTDNSIMIFAGINKADNLIKEINKELNLN